MSLTAAADVLAGIDPPAGLLSTSSSLVGPAVALVFLVLAAMPLVRAARGGRAGRFPAVMAGLGGAAVVLLLLVLTIGDTHVQSGWVVSATLSGHGGTTCIGGAIHTLVPHDWNGPECAAGSREHVAWLLVVAVVISAAAWLLVGRSQRPARAVRTGAPAPRG